MVAYRLTYVLLDAGTFASTNGEDDALGGVCYKAQEYVQYAVPVIVSEWTLNLRTGGADLVPKMFVQQVSAFAVRLCPFCLLKVLKSVQASGGSMFWSHHGDVRSTFALSSIF
jgi:hypothetical protein